MKRLAKKAMPNSGNSHILFGDRKVFMKIETSNTLEYTLEQRVKILIIFYGFKYF